MQQSQFLHNSKNVHMRTRYSERMLELSEKSVYGYRPLEEFASSRGVSDVKDEEERLVDPLASVIIATTSLIVGLLAGELLVQNSAIFRTSDIS